MDKKTQEYVKKALPALKELKAPEGMSLDEQKALFRKMCLIREFDTQVRTLWMKNEIYGLAHSYVGAEAIAVGACACLTKEDFITSTHRGHGHTIAKGADVRAMMAELHGKYEGLNHGKGGNRFQRAFARAKEFSGCGAAYQKGEDSGQSKTDSGK